MRLKTTLLIALLLLGLLSAAVFAAPSGELSTCSLSALGEVPAYMDAGMTQLAMTLLPGDGGAVVGQSADGAYAMIGGRYNVETYDPQFIRWVDYSADIALRGGCADLPVIGHQLINRSQGGCLHHFLMQERR